MAWSLFSNKGPTVHNHTQEQHALGIFLNNLTQSIRRLSGSGQHGVNPDGTRDYNALFGYGTDLSYEHYYNMYRRGGIAGVIVAKVAKACWRDLPELYVDDERVLEDEIQALASGGLLRKLERADILNRIGRYSVLFMGMPDGMEPDQPLGAGGKLEDGYAMPFSEYGCTVKGWDSDPTSRRFGMPETYQLETRELGSTNGDRIQSTPIIVHWSRIVHLAEGALDSDFEGAPALEAPWNALIDKEKVRGGSGEAFFRNARRLITLTARQGAKMDKPDLATLKDEVEAFTNGWQDFMRLKDMEADTLDANLASPRDSFDVAIEEIAGVTGIPIRVLLGKGGGQLAGSEDRASWNSLVADRQDAECTGWLIRALEIYEEAGLLEIPENMSVVWPVQEALTATEESQVIERKANAFQRIVQTVVTVAGEDVNLEQVAQTTGIDGIDFDQEELD